MVLIKLVVKFVFLIVLNGPYFLQVLLKDSTIAMSRDVSQGQGANR